MHERDREQHQNAERNHLLDQQRVTYVDEEKDRQLLRENQAETQEASSIDYLKVIVEKRHALHQALLLVFYLVEYHFVLYLYEGKKGNQSV